MIKEWLGLSFGQILVRFFDWVEERPEWLRPAFYGAGLVWAFVLARGGVVVLPIAFVVLLFKNPTLLVHQILPLFLFYVPGAGFLGGLLYSMTGPILRPLGRAGNVMQFVLGTWVYCVVLIFVIIPMTDAKPSPPLSNAENWAISGVMGIIFGLALGIQGTSPDTVPNPPTNWRMVGWVLAIGAVLIFAMKLAGWW